MKHVLSIGTLLLTAGLGFAQDRETTTTTTTTTQVTKVSNVVGGSVVLQSETLGKVTDIVINDHGCIDYLVVSYGDEYVAVPWGAVRYDTRQQTITVTSEINRQQLRDLTFAGNRWPSFSDQSWARNMRSVWGANAFRSESRAGGRGGADDRSSGTTTERPQGGDDPKRAGTPREGSGTNREESGTTRPGSGTNKEGTSRPGSGTNKEGATRPGDGASRDTPPRSGGTNQEGTTRPGSGTTPQGNPGTSPSREGVNTPGGERRGPTDPGLPRQNQRQGSGTTVPDRPSAGGAANGTSLRRPGVDETRGIDNGVNTNPNPRVTGPGAGPAGTTTGSTPGPATSPRPATPRTTDRPPQ